MSATRLNCFGPESKHHKMKVSPHGSIHCKRCLTIYHCGEWHNEPIMCMNGQEDEQEEEQYHTLTYPTSLKDISRIVVYCNSCPSLFNGTNWIVSDATCIEGNHSMVDDDHTVYCAKCLLACHGWMDEWCHSDDKCESGDRHYIRPFEDEIDAAGDLFCKYCATVFNGNNWICFQPTPLTKWEMLDMTLDRMSRYSYQSDDQDVCYPGDSQPRPHKSKQELDKELDEMVEQRELFLGVKH